LTVEGCRILARQFRDKVEAHQARAAALVGYSRACPFDLHALLPVPAAILFLGPEHPGGAGLACGALGVTDRLRQVSVRDKATTGRRLPAGHAVTSRNAAGGDRSASRALARSAVCAAAPEAGLSRTGMDAIADRQTGLDGPAVSVEPSTGSPADEPEAGEGGSPYLTLNGFTGPLDHLLTLARAQKIDIADISLTALIDQLTAALRLAPAATSLGEKGDWVVMAAWLVQLRARLLQPADAPGQQEAAAEADQLRASLAALEDVQALAQWLERQPQLGHDAFTRGRPEMFGVSVEAGPATDMTEFLWSSLALFDDEVPSDTATAYRPAPLRLHTAAEAVSAFCGG
jgi:segregation and condensation protein A